MPVGRRAAARQTHRGGAVRCSEHSDWSWAAPDSSAEGLGVGAFEEGIWSNAPSLQRYEPALGLAGGTQLEVAWEVTVSSSDLDEPAVTVTVTTDAT